MPARDADAHLHTIGIATRSRHRQRERERERERELDMEIETKTERDRQAGHLPRRVRLKVHYMGAKQRKAVRGGTIEVPSADHVNSYA